MISRLEDGRVSTAKAAEIETVVANHFNGCWSGVCALLRKLDGLDQNCLANLIDLIETVKVTLGPKAFNRPILIFWPPTVHLGILPPAGFASISRNESN